MTEPMTIAAVVLLPTEAAPASLAVALRARADATARGVCACGARVDLAALTADSAGVVNPVLEHEPNCPTLQLTESGAREAVSRGFARWATVVVDLEGGVEP